MAMDGERGSLSAVARLESSISRLRAGEAPRSFIAILADSAREEAEAADRRARAGSLRGPLDGRLVSVKGLFDVAGTVTSAGSKLLGEGNAVTDDAIAVNRLRKAGAVIVGKTQMTEFAFSALGTNPHDGTPGNPRDPKRVPGGSSSGAVVSVVEGIVDIAIGSDTGGSVRIPAALSGAVGFKPTKGRVPTSGAFSLSSTLDTIGPIAASVADCVIADAVLSGLTDHTMPKMSKSGFRLVVARGRLFDRCDPEVSGAFEEVIHRLRRKGIPVEDSSMEPVLDQIAAIDRIGTFPSIEVGATLRALGVEELDKVDPKTRVRIEAGAGVSAVDYVRMCRLRVLAVEAYEMSISENEVFILPTTPILAPLLSSVESDEGFHDLNGLVLRNPRVANMLDCPSLSLPIPVEDLPIGLMLLGRRSADRSLLAIANSIEAALSNS